MTHFALEQGIDHLPTCYSDTLTLTRHSSPQLEGPVRVLHTMMVDPNGVILRPKGKELAIAQGEILDVLQFSNEKMALCQNHIGKCMLKPQPSVWSAQNMQYSHSSLSSRDAQMLTLALRINTQFKIFNIQYQNWVLILETFCVVILVRVKVWF